MNRIKYILDKIISIVAILMTILHLYTYVIGIMPAMQQRTLFLFFILSLILLKKIRDKLEENKIDLWSLFLLASSLLACSYIFLYWDELATRTISPINLDIIFGIIIITAIINCTNIKLGIILPLITMGFIFYTLLGYRIEGEFGTTFISIERLIAYLVMDTSGIFGIVLGTAAKYIFIFIIFGAFLECSGANEFFLEFTDRLLGRTKGSGAKVDTLSSGLFGMISGSAVANVMATAPMTIPLMRKNGFSSSFAGAISSIAGTGGQLMPPIMGTAAFIIAETIAVDYVTVAKSALIPGILFYLAIWITINLHSNKIGIVVINKKQEWKTLLSKEFYYLIPILFLIITVTFFKWSPIKAGIWSIILVITASQFSIKNKMNLKLILKAMEKAAYSSLSVGVACATAGIIIGTLSLTGLGLKLSSILILFSGNSLNILLVLTMIAGLILGMGMTTTSVYIVLSVLVAPALVNFGVSPMAAHLFVFYYGILSCITPPVSTAVYAAASIAKASPMKLAFYTSKLALPIYILPFIFVFNQELLMLKGSFFQIIVETFFAILFLISSISALEGYYINKISNLERVMLGMSSILLIKKIIILRIIGIIVIGLILIKNMKKIKD